jgi:hypothetical protein
MNVDYKNIHGWFDYEDLYDYVIEKLQDNSNIAECGCWIGKSSCYLNHKIKDSSKLINHFIFDSFEGNKEWSESEFHTLNHLILNKRSQYDVFMENRKKYNFENSIIIKGTFSETMKAFPDEFFDFIYIDMSHDMESVYSDLITSYTKLKTNGFLAGHDYSHINVKLAYNKFLSEYKTFNFKVINNSCIFNKL